MAQKKAKTTRRKNTTKSTKTPKPTLEDMKVADGKDSLAKSVEEVKDLEDLLGVQQSNPFRTTSAAILEERMNEMTLTESV
jgi:hypothetical protein